MQKELIGHIAEFSNELQISRTKRGQAGQPVTAVSYQAASTGSTAQAGGQGLMTLSGSAVSGNVSDISDINKCLSKQQECEKFIDRSVNGKNSNAKPFQELEVGMNLKGKIVIALINYGAHALYNYVGSNVGDMTFRKGDQMDL